MMKNLLLFSTLLLVQICLAQTPKKLNNLKDSASYVYGTNIGNNIKQQTDLDLDNIIQGIKDAYYGKNTKIEPAIAQQCLNTYIEQEKINAPVKNKAKEVKFLAANKIKKGVFTTTSGLQYEILAQGKGEKPSATDQVTVHYRGTLLDGGEFDNSYKRGEPITFPLTGVIKGWTEGLQLMQVGSKFKFYIPAALAYGDYPPPGASIPPAATLVFEVELLGIVK